MSKNIVVCYDGTNAEYRKYNTNVVKTFEAIERDDSQVAFYDPGVGTFSFFGRRLGRRVGALLGMAFGYGIRQNIEDGYEYLMNTFRPEDNVFIFGFSRGAYTARALAGMIHQFGILQKGSKNLIPYVSKMYFKKDNQKDFSVIKGFKKTFSNVCEPRFIGLWDTVGALWDESSKKDTQVIEQVWFPGVHSEVGGGCSKDECSLQGIALAWMMDKASQCDLRLKDGWQDGLNQDAAVDMHDSSTSFPWFIPGLRKEREIPEGALVHQSVIDRAEKRADYRPKLPNNRRIVSTDSYTNIG